MKKFFDYISRLVQHPWFERVTLIAIVMNSLVLILETYSGVMAQYGSLLVHIDHLFLGYFILELALRIVTFRGSFFKGGWNWFDMCIVIVTSLPIFGNVSALRALRILRALRLLGMVPSFRHVLESIARSIQMSGALVVVFGIVLGIFATLASKLYGVLMPEYFGNFHRSLFTLFQIVTLDAWSDIVRPLGEQAPSAFLFFPFFVIVTVFVLLSVLIGIATSAVQLGHQDTPGDDKDALTESTARELIEALRAHKR